MRTCGLHHLLSRSSAFEVPADCREFSESFLRGRDFVAASCGTSFCSPAAEARTGSTSSSMSFLPSLSFISSWHRSLSSSSSSSSSVSRRFLSSDGRRATRRRGGHGRYVEICNLVHIQTIHRRSVLNNFDCRQKNGKIFSNWYTGASAVVPIRSLIISSNPSTSLSSLSTVENEVPDCSPAASPTAAYVHLPFCRRRCFYCDFPILAVGERTEQSKSHIDSFMSDYVDLVCTEIATTANRSPKGATSPLKTVFFGGGTPSLVPVPLLARIMDELKRHFEVENDAEISMEMDPGTFDRFKLAGFLESGVTRLSLGVQSFQAELLQACGRAHGLQEVYDAVDAIHWNGLKNWSLDLIASLPNQTLQQWEHSLKEAVSLKPAHVSVYDLQIEEGTLFNRWFKAGQEPLPSDEKSAELYSTASRTLREAGFEHYEVSNYAMPGFQCRHNLVYWENQPYYAFGLGSTSYVEGRRFSRPRRLKEYATYVKTLEASRPEPTQSPQLSVEDQVLDTVMLSLRLARGLNLREFEGKFGSSLTATLCNGLVPFVETGHVETLDAQRQTIASSVYIQNWKDAKRDASKLSETLAIRDLTGSNGNLLEGSRLEENARGPTVVTPRSLQRSGGCSGRAAFVRLTDPEGFLLSNEVISSVFAALPSGGGF